VIFPYDLQVIDDMVFAIGGFNGVTTIFSVECFDAATDEW
jgi:kelch-like protein 10